jgi:site-specific recombinase XerD
MASDLIPSGDARLSAGGAYTPDLIPTYLQRFDREHTRRSYRNDLIQFFGDELVTLDDVRAITFVQVNRYLADRETAGIKSSTLRRQLAAIRGFFDWLLALGIVSANPANRQVVRRIRGGTQRDRAIVFLTGDQATALIDAADDHGEAAMRDRTLIMTMLYCVLRRSEAAAMNVEHIRPLGGYWVLDLPSTKGGADQYVKIPEHVVEAVEEYKAHYGITSGALWRSLANNYRGRRLSDRSIYTIVHRASVAAGIHENVGAHTLRHTGCTLAIESGASLQQVQAHARHKNLETTMNYVHQRDRLRDSAADFIKLGKSKRRGPG